MYDTKLKLLIACVLVVGIIRIIAQLKGKISSTWPDMISYFILGGLDLVTVWLSLRTGEPAFHELLFAVLFFILAGVEWRQLRRKNKE